MRQFMMLLPFLYLWPAAAPTERLPGHNDFGDEVSRIDGVMVNLWRQEQEGGYDVELDASLYGPDGELNGRGAAVVRRVQAAGERHGVPGPYFFSRHEPAVED